jgi:mannose-6-phosphate isomerase-like protein (cupin superfamily)
MAQLIKAGDGEAYGTPDGRMDRFLLDATATEGRLSVVEHTVGPRILAAPLHRHTLEDEYSLVLEGELGALLGDEEVYAGPGDFVVKPRGQWHTFWNAGDSTLRLLEIITPGGMEELFKTLGRAGDKYDPDELPALAAAYGGTVDFERSMAIATRFGLEF